MNLNGKLIGHICTNPDVLCIDRFGSDWFGLDGVFCVVNQQTVVRFAQLSSLAWDDYQPIVNWCNRYTLGAHTSSVITYFFNTKWPINYFR